MNIFFIVKNFFIYRKKISLKLPQKNGTLIQTQFIEDTFLAQLMVKRAWI